MIALKLAIDPPGVNTPPAVSGGKRIHAQIHFNALCSSVTNAGETANIPVY
jgi:hypothetical protein